MKSPYLCKCYIKSTEQIAGLQNTKGFFLFYSVTAAKICKDSERPQLSLKSRSVRLPFGKAFSRLIELQAWDLGVPEIPCLGKKIQSGQVMKSPHQIDSDTGCTMFSNLSRTPTMKKARASSYCSLPNVKSACN